MRIAQRRSDALRRYAMDLASRASGRGDVGRGNLIINVASSTKCPSCPPDHQYWTSIWPRNAVIWRSWMLEFSRARPKNGWRFRSST